MTDLSDLLRADAVLFGLSVLGKKPLFAQLGFALARQTGADPRAVAEALAERERLGSTGFGGGVAIPHAKLAGIGHIACVFARLQQPVDYDAVDGAPVDLVMAMLSPPMAGAEHLKALARVSRRLRDRGLLAKLRGAGSPDALWALLTEDRTRDAA